MENMFQTKHFGWWLFRYFGTLTFWCWLGITVTLWIFISQDDNFPSLYPNHHTTLLGIILAEWNAVLTFIKFLLSLKLF